MPPEPLARFRVLLVVRGASERSALGQLLEPDFDLTLAGTSEEAAAQLKGGRFEVLLIEQKLDGRTGLEIAADVATLPGLTSCILLADKAEDVSPPLRSTAQLLTVVVKPWHAARLVRLLEQSARLTLARRAADALQKQRGN